MLNSKLGLLSILLLAPLSQGAVRPTPTAANLPLAFEALSGKAKGSSAYMARGAGYSLVVEPAGAYLSLGRNGGATKFTRVRLAGFSATARANPEGMLPGKVNYFIGSDPRKWRTGISTYSGAKKVRYSGVYPGVDLIYYGNGARLEFDFIVQPNHSPSSIHLLLDSPDPVSVDAAGDLVAGEFRQHRPVAYQMKGADRVPVACQYALRKGHEVAMEVGAYDHTLPLIIDPVLSYGAYLGGSGNDGVTSVKVDGSGNLFMAGFTSSPNFPIHGAAQPAYSGTNSPVLQGQFGDAFVAKMNPSGTALLYATYLGGSGDDFAASLAIDTSGNAYVVGSTQSSNFPTSAGAIQKTYKGFTDSDNNGFYNPGDGWAAKLNSTGNQLLYSTYLGGSLNDLALGVAVDSNGNAIVVGSTESSDFPTTANALAPRFRGNANGGPSIGGDGFVAILNPAGTALTYSTFLGGRSHDGARGVAVDAQNNIYVCGVTFSGDFPTTAGALLTTYKGTETNPNFGPTSGHGFVTKFSPAGAMIYSTYLGGSNIDAASAIAVDSAGAAYVTGGTISTDFPVTANAPQSSYKGSGAYGTIGDAYGGDAFIAKLNPAGSALVYSTYLGGKGDETGMDIAIDAAGDAYVTGFTTSPEFPVTADALQRVNAGLGGQGLAPNPSQGFDTERVRNTGDAFLVKMSPTGALLYSSFYGGAMDDTGLAIAVDSAGNPYVGGNTVSPALKTSAGALQSTYSGTGTQWPRGDGFVVKFDFGGAAVGSPARVNVVPGFTAVGTVGTALPAPFTVQVVDANGAAVPGVTVAFTATNASVNPASAVTGATGMASTAVTLGTAAGPGSVTATVAGVPAATAALTLNVAAALPVLKALVNGASFGPMVSPGSWISVYTDQTAAATVSAGVAQRPTTLGGFQVLINGTAIPIDIVAQQAGGGTQINAQLPYEVPVGAAQAVVKYNGLASAAFPFTVQASAPGIFVFGNNRAAAQNILPDGSFLLNTADTPVPAGDYITVYLTGQGPLDNPIPTNTLAPASPFSIPTLPYSATLGGNPVTVSFLGMTPGQIALAQANILIPRDFKPGTYPLVIAIGSAQSNGPVITVTDPRP